ncbi:cysteine desulfurase [Candidatus Microgenomates bacterium]|nr:cysteine desulfurase [Candidatus Microgenomates bacterium]
MRKNKLVYFDNSATTKVDPQVREAMLPFLTEECGNPSSLHSPGQKAREAIEEARKNLAGFLGCTPREIIFTSCATEANNLALKGLCQSFHRCTICGAACPDQGKTPHIIVSPIEHHCVLDTAKSLEKQGYEVTWLPVDKYGLVSVEEIRKSVKDNTVLISIMCVNNEIGTVEPITEIGQMIKEVNRERFNNGLKRIYFHTDAVQAVQYLDCRVDHLGVDLLSLSAHKFYGPKGVGVLYAQRGTPLVRQMDGGGQEFNLRAGTENVAGIVGLGKAIQLVKEHESETKKIEKLRDCLIDGVLKNVPKARLTGHPKQRAPHIASFVIDGAEGESILLKLDEKGIAVSSGSACTSGTLEPSHVILACGTPIELSHGSLRISLGKDNTEEEVNYFLEVFPPIVKQLREMSPIK